jgi:hypothetical protein
MPRRTCPDLYPDPRPSRLLAPLLPFLPVALRALPWLAAAPAALALAAMIITTIPVLTWGLLCLAVLAPLAAGLALLRLGWE